MEEKVAFKIMESVRKGRGLPDGAEDEMLKIGVPDWYIDSCKKIKYLFPKAHAAAYVTMGFRIAWFKVHYPIAFYSAHFYVRSQKGHFDAESMTRGLDVVRAKLRELHALSDAKNATAKDEDLITTLEVCYEFYLRGFTFANIDLYESDAVKFNVVDERTLRPPFIAIGGLGKMAANDIAERRSGHEFISVSDFSSVCAKVSAAHIDQMKILGVLSALPENSQLSLF
jgi:DNA polymerase-3 subunit alpha (Gram-positive type)